jgi:chromosome segregation ATPase
MERMVTMMDKQTNTMMERMNTLMEATTNTNRDNIHNLSKKIDSRLKPIESGVAVIAEEQESLSKRLKKLEDSSSGLCAGPNFGDAELAAANARAEELKSDMLKINEEAKKRLDECNTKFSSDEWPQISKLQERISKIEMTPQDLLLASLRWFPGLQVALPALLSETMQDLHHNLFHPHTPLLTTKTRTLPRGSTVSKIRA